MRSVVSSLALLGLLLVPRVSARAQWQPQSSGTDAELRGLSVVSGAVAWVSGTHGRFGRTADGGRTWRVDTIPGATTLDLRAIHAIDPRTAVVMSAGEAEKGQARIFRTTDAGKTWRLVFTTEQKGVFLDAVAFWDARHGIALSDPVDGRLFLLTTDDGGRSWTRIPPDRLPATLDGEAFFAASGSCLTVQGSSAVWIGSGGGAAARVFRSSDRGRTWGVADTPVQAGNASSGIFSVAFHDARRGVAVGGDYRQAHGTSPNVALTDDGGRTWRPPKGALPAGYMSAVSFADASRVVAVGLAGTALSSDGGESWTIADTVAYNSTRFVSASTGWTAGPRGRIARWRQPTR
jgi:photosystem II stability/assembly factor-like uncharacterized protein